jgi:hypothetical protein
LGQDQKLRREYADDVLPLDLLGGCVGGDGTSGFDDAGFLKVCHQSGVAGDNDSFHLVSPQS